MSDIFTFEDGVDLEQTYLRVDEQSTYIDVYCDGYVLRLQKAVGSDDIQIRNNSGTELADLRSSVFVSSTSYYFFYTVKQAIILTNTPTFVRILLIGNYDDSYGGGSPLTNSTQVKLYVNIFSDRFTTRLEWEISDTITIGNSDANNQHLGINCSVGSLTNENNVYENSPSETNAVNYTTYNLTQYLGMLSNEINIQAIILEETHTGDASFDQVNTIDGYFLFRWNNGTITAGTHSVTSMWVIDSADREYGSKKYSSVERLEIGDQYKDHFIS